MNLITYEPITNQIYVLDNVNKLLINLKDILDSNEFNIWFKLEDLEFLILDMEVCDEL